MTRNQRIALALPLAVLVAAAAAAGLWAAQRRKGTAQRRGDSRPPVAIAIAAVPPEPSIWLDVHQPPKLWKALRSNAWLSRAAVEPLGQGLATGWSGFLGSRGSDLGAVEALRGTVLDQVVDGLLADPFRVIFFSGPGATGTPAVVVPRPSAAASAAFDLLDGLARSGSYSATHCPGAPAPAPTAGQPSPPVAVVSRWLLAEHAVFAARQAGRIVLSRSPLAVVQGLCAQPPDVPPAQGVDISLSFSREALGREAQLAASLLGLGPAPRFAFALEGDRLEPRGILSDLAEQGRLDRAAPSEPLLRLLPADAGVVFLATLRLPETLTSESLQQHLSRSYQGPYAARTVALLWNPRGAGRLATEVALAWPERDAALLREAFRGPNRMDRRRACGHEVLASTRALGQALQSSCEGKVPSLLAAAPAVAQGLRAPASFAVGANLGAALSRILAESWTAEVDPPRKPDPDIEAARRLLEELPFLGLRGVIEAGALVPGGFRS